MLFLILMKPGVIVAEFPPHTPVTGVLRAATVLFHQEIWKDDEVEAELLDHAIVAHDSAGTVMAAGTLAAIVSRDLPRITQLATAEPYRGDGLGREVVKLLEQQARILGARAVRLNALEDSKSFFAEIGYIENPESDENEMLKLLDWVDQ
jgi:N-acetylglutamate synthase-like GNAT family acetyltransferase